MEFALIAAFGAMLSWGIGDFLIQRTTRKIGDVETLAWIGIIGAVGLAPFVIGHLDEITGKGWLWLLILGILTLVSALFDFEALKVGKISVVDMVFIIELPLTILFGILFLDEALTLWQMLLTLFLIWGVALISLGEGRRTFTFEKGVWLAIIAALGMALVNFLTALSAIETTPLLAVWFPWVFFTFFCVIILWRRKTLRQCITHVRHHTGLIVWMGVFDTAAWVFYAFALTLADLGIVTAITESYPVIALILGVLVNHERLVARQYLGAGIAMGASIVLALTL